VNVGGWLTTVRFHRAASLLLLVPTGKDGIASQDLFRAAWHECGGPADEIQQLTDFLESLGLLKVREQIVVRTTAGERISRRIALGNRTGLALAVIREGCFHDQARKLLELGTRNDNGDFLCSIRIAREAAAQLIGLLELWQAVDTSPTLRIPRELIAELDSVWALLPREPNSPPWILERLAVGDRAEAYTVQYERSQVDDPGVVHWVSKESDALGWDVEDRSRLPSRCIEVKGRRDATITFYLTANELKQAEALGPRYELQFWGGINLQEDPADEYRRLRASGYPLRFENLAEELKKAAWNLAATEWRVTRQ